MAGGGGEAGRREAGWGDRGPMPSAQPLPCPSRFLPAFPPSRLPASVDPKMMRRRNQLTQILIPLDCVGEQRQMTSVGERQFGAGNRLETVLFRRLGELHRAVESVMIGDGERAIAQLFGAKNQLVGL